MIFASDLDRTIIYSKVFVNDTSVASTIVEWMEEKDITHTTSRSVELLQEVSRKLMFIPVTTRSLDQYNRVNLFHSTVKPKYAVVCNGGMLLKNGIIDKSWENKIKASMKEIISPKGLLEECKFFIEDDKVKSHRVCDELFIYVVLKQSEVNEENLNRLSAAAERRGYITVKNNKKIYVIPSFINKWDPVSYIMKQEEKTYLISSGDSLLDLPMLKNSSYSIVPKHGELNTHYKEQINSIKELYITEAEGLAAGEEILNKIINIIQ